MSHNAPPITTAPHRPQRQTDVTQCPSCHNCPHRPQKQSANKRHTMPLMSPLPPPTPKAIGKPTSHNALLSPLPPPTPKAIDKPTSHNAPHVTTPPEPNINRQTDVTLCPSCHHCPRDPNINRLTDVTQCPTYHHCPHRPQRQTDVTQCPSCHNCPHRPQKQSANKRHTMPLMSPLPPPTPKAIGKPTSHNALLSPLPPPTPKAIDKPTSHNAPHVTTPPEPNINRQTDVTQCPSCHHCPPPTPTANGRHTMPLMIPLPHRPQRQTDVTQCLPIRSIMHRPAQSHSTFFIIACCHPSADHPSTACQPIPHSPSLRCLSSTAHPSTISHHAGLPSSVHIVRAVLPAMVTWLLICAITKRPQSIIVGKIAIFMFERRRCYQFTARPIMRSPPKPRTPPSLS